MRPIWSGALSFGLVNIPVRLYTASESISIDFDLLHKKDLSPIRYARMCKKEEKEIPYKDIVKGYEYQKGEYIVVSDEDFQHVKKHKSNTIEIVGFSLEEEIDSIYFEKPYFLEPDKKTANKAYSLLREALQHSKKVGIVKFIFRDREHLGIIKPYLNVILLEQLRFASEIRNVEDLKIPEDESINKKEVDMALKLIDQLTIEFNPESYKDTYVDDLKEIIDEKVQGIAPQKIRSEPTPKSTKIHDIMSLLKASLKDEEETTKKREKKQNLNQK